MTDPIPGAGAGSAAGSDGAMRTERTSGVVRAGGMMAFATLISRVTGFVAKVVLLAFFGAWVVSDSYNLANTLPNIIFELLIGGVLTSVAIPLLSRARSDPDGGAAYTQRLTTLAVAVLAVATAAAMLAAPLLIRLYQSGGHADPTLATQLAYLLLPQIFFYGVAALIGAILNTDERFAAPAWAPVANNIVVIGVGIALFTTAATGGASVHGLTKLSTAQFLLLGLGTTAGIVLQAAVMLPSLRQSGFALRWRFGLDARMAEAGRLMAWAIAYALISQVGYIVTARVSFAARDGFFTLYNFGSMLFQLPYGILGVSLLTAIMPRMSRHAADGDIPAVKRDMSLANRLSGVALVPVSAAMIALAVPLAIVSARYGKVTDSDARILAWTLAAFAIGLLPLAITLVQMRVFYAMKDGRTPAVINGIMVAVRIPLLLGCLALPQSWVVPGLAGAMSVSSVVGVAIGEVWLRARFGRMSLAATLGPIGRTAAASAVGGLAAWAVTAGLMSADESDSLVGAVAQLIVGLIVGLVVTAGGLVLLHVEEVEALRRRLGARLGRYLSVNGSGGERHDIGPDRGTLVGAMLQRPADAEAAPADRTFGTEGQESVTDQHNEPAAHRAGGPPRRPTDPPREPSLRPGTVVGERYRLTRLIATDAVGNEFWQARDTVLPRDMAVTVLPATDPTSATVTGTLRVGRLHHAGLPQTLDMGSVGDAAYVAGQWVDGATVTDLLRDGPLETRIAERLVAGVADAVADAHAAGLALGAVHPSLVRVNFDGQVRLSHVVARGGAVPADDIRALGALLYLMLTATWPLDPADGPAGARPAPRRGGTEMPAARVTPSAPSELSRLAERALHPETARGITSAAEIVALARQSDAAAAPVMGSGTTGIEQRTRAVRARVRHASRADRAGKAPRGVSPSQTTPAPLLRDRRIKLSIAGGMLTVLAVLLVIMVASVTKQFLAGILQPIEAADQQQLITATTPTTTLSVGSTTSAGTTNTGSAPGTTPAVPIPVANATVYDPQGTPPADYESYVDRAFDGDQSTFWPTWVYRQQFGPGGIKSGVGLLLTFAKPVTPTSVTVSTTMPGTGVEIRTAASANPALASTTVLGTAALGADPVHISLTNAPTSRYLIVWINKLAPYQGTSAENQGQFQSDLAEITVAGS